VPRFPRSSGLPPWHWEGAPQVLRSHLHTPRPEQEDIKSIHTLAKSPPWDTPALFALVCPVRGRPTGTPQPPGHATPGQTAIWARARWGTACPGEKENCLEKN